MIAQVQLALMLLTRLPVGRLRGAGAVPTLPQVVWAFPLVGAVVGALAAAVAGLALALGSPSDVAALLAVAAGVLVTGGLHEDGLADLADGFGGGRDAAHKLAIMRDSRIGSYGTLALILALGLRVLCLGHSLDGAEAAGGGGPGVWAQAALALIGIESASRAGMAVMLWALPAARSDGLGKSAAGGSGRAVLGAVVLGAAGLAVGFGAGPGALAVAGALALAQTALGALARRQIGGQTGDVLGGAQQIGASAAWIAALAIS